MLLGPKWAPRQPKGSFLGAILGAEWNGFEDLATAILEQRAGCVKWIGVEWSRVEWSRVEQNGVEWIGAEWRRVA